MLIDSLGHPLKHIGLDLTHLLHVLFLLDALWLSGHGVKGPLLRREGWDARLWIGSKTTRYGNVLPGTAFRTEHAVGWNLGAARIAVHGTPLPKVAYATLPKGLRRDFHP